MAVNPDVISDRLRDTDKKVQQFLQSPHQQSLKARKEALAAAKKLVRELEDGEDAHFAQFENVCSAFVLQTLLSMGVAKAMPEAGSISVDELATKVNSSPELIARLMRLVVATGVFQEPKIGFYEHTNQSRLCLDPGCAAWLKLMTTVASTAFVKMPEYFATHERVSPTNMKNNPLTFACGTDGEDWHMIYARSPEMVQTFVIAMSAQIRCFSESGAYPYGEQLLAKSQQALKEGSAFMVDIGGSDGSTTKAICAEHPELKGKVIVQDQQKVIDAIQPGSLPDGFEAMATDFWKPQTVKAKVYFLKRIMHDWPDKESALILSNQVKAMDEDSIVLISDIVIPEQSQNFDTCPYWMDMLMLHFAGKERTATEWNALFDRAGLELTKIWKPEVGFQCIIEGRKKRA